MKRLWKGLNGLARIPVTLGSVALLWACLRVSDWAIEACAESVDRNLWLSFGYFVLALASVLLGFFQLFDASRYLQANSGDQLRARVSESCKAAAVVAGDAADRCRQGGLEANAVAFDNVERYFRDTSGEYQAKV